jgi:methyltransferase (TIGR00027 family)
VTAGRSAGPDLTAVGAAFGRAAHVRLDDAPYVLEDVVSIGLADDEFLRAADLLGPDGRLLVSRDDPRARWRGTFVGRARFVEDLVGERLEDGVAQLVILGAGLDTFAQRRPDMASRLRIFEVDEPATQRWKQGRLRELGLPIPEGLRFVPVNFESGDSWVRAIAAAGFDLGAPSIVASAGVTQYISVAALETTVREGAGLAPGTTFVCTFVLPVALIDPEERELRLATESRAAARGFPWMSFYSPADICALAAGAGFDDVRHVSASELNERYFRGRSDGLRAASGEQLVVATRRQ